MAHELQDHLLPELSALSLKYLLPSELIDLGIPVTAQVVDILLGPDVCTMKPQRLINRFREYAATVNPLSIPPIIGEGFIALLLLDRLPSDLLSAGLIKYLGTGSVGVRELVYPHLMKLLNYLSNPHSHLSDYIIGIIIDTEAYRPSTDSVIELAYTETSEQHLLLYLLEPTAMIAHGNIDFVLHHINELPINPEMVVSALDKEELRAGEILLRQLFVPINEINFKRNCCKVEPDVVDTMLNLIKQRLPSLYNWTLERSHKLLR